MKITHALIVTSTLAGALFAAACGGTQVPAHVTMLGGRQVEVATAGTAGAATVVFEAGLGDDWTTWDEVASRVSAHARVFAYSRPGYGASDPTSTSRAPNQIVAELRALLALEDVAPPYVLVGHSMGGTYLELFAKQHPKEVAGVVLVDPRHRDFLATCEAAALDNCGIPEDLLQMQPPAQIAEYHAFTLASEQIGAAGDFGDYPVRVLTATSHPVSPAREALWQTMLGDLAAESAQGEQIIVEGAGHYIQSERPQEVVSAVLAVLPSTEK